MPISKHTNGYTCSCFNAETNQLLGKERKCVMILAIVFLVVFTSYMSIQNLQSSINEADGLGVTSLMCVYIAFGISCVFAPLVVRILSAKGVIVTSCLVHLVYAISNFYPRFWTILPTSVLLGLTSGPFWTAQGMYITTCSYIYADRSKKSPSHILSKYFSTFNIIFVWSTIIGNIMSSVLLNLQRPTDGSSTNVSILYTSTHNISIINGSEHMKHRCAIYFCPETGGNVAAANEKPDTEYLYYLLGLFVTFVAIGTGIAVICLPPLPKTPDGRQKTRSVSSVGACVGLLRNPTMILLCPSFVAYSWAEGFRWSDISHVS